MQVVENIGLCFHFENNERDMWSGRAIDLDLWRVPAKAQGIAKFAIIDESDCRYRWTDSEVTLEEYDSLEDFEKAHVGDQLVYVERRKTVSGLPNHYDVRHYPFNFDEMTWFIVGPASGLRPADSDERTWVYLPQINEEMTKFGFQAANTLADYIGLLYLDRQEWLK